VSVDLAAGSTLAGFRVERLLGRGAMGAVYLAEDVHLKRRSAIKVLGPELAEDERFRRRFLLESQLAASLDHPHIVPIYAAGEEQDVLYLAMKYVEGYDLRAAAYRRVTLKLEREVAPFAAYAKPVLPELFSARLGCRVEQPIVGAVSIGALCVKPS
jgi:serine/threonine protein kinase